MTSWSAVALLAAALLAPMQDESDPGHGLPADLQPFWTKYWAAKQADDESEMAKAVRGFRTQAEDSLDIFLDNYCNAPTDTMPDELRTLANTLDGVLHGSRFIERVRLVLDMDKSQRTTRFAARQLLGEARRRSDEAREQKTEEAWNVAGRLYRRIADTFEGINDHESAITALWELQIVETELNHPMERAKACARIIELAGKLPFNEARAVDATEQLEALKKMGYDPEHPDELTPPPKAQPAGGAAPASAPTGAPLEGKGHGLEAWAEGSTDVVVKLELDSPKKGLAPVVLPSFFPLDDEFLWTYSWIKGNGPAPFDTQRSIRLMPGGKGWQLLRDGLSFSIDGDGDGKGDVSFTPTSSPQRIEVPLADGRHWPLMVSVPGDREQTFGIELNYAPEKDAARLRFNVAGAMKGDVLGEPWLIYDNNLSGTYGDTVDQWGDGFTPDQPDDRTFFRDPDAVLIGKAKVAQPWSPVMPLQDGFWRATLTPEGTDLTLRKMDLELGAVKLDCATKVAPTHVLIEEVSGTLPGVVLNVVPAKRGAAVPVPAGTWQFVMGRLESGTKTGMDQVRIYRGHAKPFEVKAGETYTLQLGAPYQLRLKPGPEDMKTEEGETKIQLTSLRTFGRGGEEYALLHNEPLQPEVEIVGPDGKKLGKPIKTMRADIALWQTDGERSLYFPAPLVVSELKPGAYTFHLTQKSHPLLGGPFGPEPAETSAPAKDGGKP
jgi:hypothetical protein